MLIYFYGQLLPIWKIMILEVERERGVGGGIYENGRAIIKDCNPYT
jgi:hypothetical protein